jgi:hypothetical protein
MVTAMGKMIFTSLRDFLELFHLDLAFLPRGKKAHQGRLYKRYESHIGNIAAIAIGQRYRAPRSLSARWPSAVTLRRLFRLEARNVFAGNPNSMAV